MIRGKQSKHMIAFSIAHLHAYALHTHKPYGYTYPSDSPSQSGASRPQVPPLVAWTRHLPAHSRPSWSWRTRSGTHCPAWLSSPWCESNTCLHRADRVVCNRERREHKSRKIISRFKVYTHVTISRASMHAISVPTCVHKLDDESHTCRLVHAHILCLVIQRCIQVEQQIGWSIRVPGQLIIL